MSVLTLPARAIRSAGRVPHRLLWRLLEALTPRRTVRARGLTFTLSCDNWITQFRMDTFETKEPETLDWIDEQMRDGDLFFDIGGNIGVFTVYAALRHLRTSVVVFEPEYANLHLLRDNIVANRLGDRVQTHSIAISDRTGVSRLHVQDLTPGAALHSESVAQLQTTDSGERVVLAEGIWAMRLDDFCEQTGQWPTVIKIDVDGAESRVLAGARETLSRPALRSLIVEAGRPGLQAEASGLLEAAGLHRVELGPQSSGSNEVWVR
jgi:FkbM family methyltransferase